MKRLKGEALDGAAVILVALFLIWGALAINMHLWDGRGVSPRFFPILLACIIAAFGLIIILRSLFAPAGETPKRPIPTIDFRLGAYEARVPAPVLLVAATALLLLLVKTLGFPLTAALYIFTLLRLLRPESGKRQSALIAIGVSLVVFAVFYHGFKVYLPIGFGL